MTSFRKDKGGSEGPTEPKESRRKQEKARWQSQREPEKARLREGSKRQSGRRREIRVEGRGEKKII